MDTTEQKQRPIVVIDGLNVFIRHFCANPTVTASGELVGGVVGFIKFIEWIVVNMSPQKIYVIWEKGGPSAKRKSLYSEYKANRARIDGLETTNKPMKTDRIIDNTESKQRQLLMLVELLKHLPVCQIYHQECECDDILAYIIKEKLTDPSAQKIVVSSDKDFYQLLTREDVIIYDQSKKMFINSDHVYEKFGIHPKNFVLARTVDGDESDNIDGIKGIGFKKLLKAVPELGDKEKELDINMMLESCRKSLMEKPKSKDAKAIIDGEDIIRRNWQLMYLGLGSLSALQAMKINKTLENYSPKYDHLNFLKTLQKLDLVIPLDFNLLASQLKICLLTSS